MFSGLFEISVPRSYGLRDIFRQQVRVRGAEVLCQKLLHLASSHELADASETTRIPAPARDDLRSSCPV